MNTRITALETITLASSLLLLFSGTGAVFFLFYRRMLYVYYNYLIQLEALFLLLPILILSSINWKRFTYDMDFEKPRLYPLVMASMLAVGATVLFHFSHVIDLSTNSVAFYLSKPIHIVEQLMRNYPVVLKNSLKILIVTAVLQEMFWRGIVQNYLLKVSNPVFAVITTSFLFFIWNMFEVPVSNIYPYRQLVLSMLLGYMYYRYRSIWIPIAMHFFAVWVPYVLFL